MKRVLSNMDDAMRKVAEVMDLDILDDILRNDGIAGVPRGIKLMSELTELGMKKVVIGTVLKPKDWTVLLILNCYVQVVE